jgi:Domain of unknown function (DUF5655)
VTAWVCPRCGRSFGRENQPHSCRPADAATATTAPRSPEQAAIADAVLAFVAGLGPAIVEGVGKRVMIKRSRTFAELIFGRSGVELAFLLSRDVDSPRVVRRLALTARRTAHVIALADPSSVDDEVRGWLAEAWASSPS